MIDITLDEYELDYKVELPTFSTMTESLSLIGNFADKVSQKIGDLVKEQTSSDDSVEGIWTKTDDEIAEIEASITDEDQKALFQEAVAAYKQNVEDGKFSFSTDATLDDVISNLGDQVESTMIESCIPSNTLVLYLADDEKSAADSMLEDEMDNILDAFSNCSSASDVKTNIENNFKFSFSDGGSGAQSEALEIADEIKDWIVNGTEPTGTAAQLVDYFKEVAESAKTDNGTQRFGLWEALYWAMQESGEMSQIENPLTTVMAAAGFFYSSLICGVIGAYLTATITTTIHVAPVIGLGVSFLSVGIVHYIEAVYSMIVSFMDPDPATGQLVQCTSLKDSVAYMYGGTGIGTGPYIQSLIVGVTWGVILVPVLSTGSNSVLGSVYTIGQWVLFAVIVAAYAAMVACAYASNLLQDNTPWDTMLNIFGEGFFEDGDDFYAFFMALGVKASLLLTEVTITDWAIPLDNGYGIILPVGP